MKHARPDYDRIQDPENKIPADDPVFLLRAQDRTSAQIVRLWAHAQRSLPDADGYLVKLAEQHANLMDAWPKKKTADRSV